MQTYLIAPLMQPTVKVHQIFQLRECNLLFRFRGQYSFLSKQLLSKRRILVIKEYNFQLNLQGQFLLLSSKGCFFHWLNSDSGEGNEMLFQCLSTNAERIQCVLKIVFEFMITQMTQRAKHKTPCKRFFVILMFQAQTFKVKSKFLY